MKALHEQEEREKKMKSATMRVAPAVVPSGDLKEIFRQREMTNRKKAREEDIDLSATLKQRDEERERKLQKRPLLFETDTSKQVRDRVLNDVEKTLKETGTSYLMDSIKSKQGINDSNMSYLSQ
jgi:hypothetical protein